jgi:hypothetical protein
MQLLRAVVCAGLAASALAVLGSDVSGATMPSSYSCLKGQGHAFTIVRARFGAQGLREGAVTPLCCRRSGVTSRTARRTQTARTRFTTRGPVGCRYARGRACTCALCASPISCGAHFLRAVGNEAHHILCVCVGRGRVPFPLLFVRQPRRPGGRHRELSRAVQHHDARGAARVIWHVRGWRRAHLVWAARIPLLPPLPLPAGCGSTSRVPSTGLAAPARTSTSSRCAISCGVSRSISRSFVRPAHCPRICRR